VEVADPLFTPSPVTISTPLGLALVGLSRSLSVLRMLGFIYRVGAKDSSSFLAARIYGPQVLSALHLPYSGYFSILLDGMIGHLGWLRLSFGLIH
jgi:hypothetical protein